MSRRFKATEEPKIEERFDYAEEVRKQIDRCLISFSNDDGSDFSRTMTENTIRALENLVPVDDRDEQFEKDLKAANKDEWIDNRKEWCGSLMGPKMYKTDPENKTLYHGKYRETVQNQEPIKVMDAHKYFRACFNQFVRLKVVVRRSTRAG